MPNVLLNRRVVLSVTENIGENFNPAALALFNAMDNEPNAHNKIIYNNVIRYWICTGDWVESDIIHVPYVGTGQGEQAATLNWKNPGISSTIVPGGFASFADLDGWNDPDGITTFLDTNFTPSTQGVKYTLNDGCFWTWNKTNIQEQTVYIGVYQGTSFSAIIPRGNSSLAFGFVNDGITGVFDNNADSSEVVGAKRTDASTVRIERNGILIKEDADASTSLANISFYYGARHDVAGPSFPCTNIIQAGGVGSKLLNLANIATGIRYLKDNLT